MLVAKYEWFNWEMRAVEGSQRNQRREAPGTILGADAARPWLEDESRSKMVRRVLSLLLAGIAIWLFVTT